MKQKYFVFMLSIILSFLTFSYLVYRIVFLNDLGTFWGGAIVISIITFGLCIKIFSANNILKREELPEELKKKYNDQLIILIRNKDANAFIIINFIYNIIFWNPMKYSKIFFVWVILIIIILIYLIREFFKYKKSSR
ncbi:hypothetical protein [Lactococcus petauri]